MRRLARRVRKTKESKSEETGRESTTGHPSATNMMALRFVSVRRWKAQKALFAAIKGSFGGY